MKKKYLILITSFLLIGCGVLKESRSEWKQPEEKKTEIMWQNPVGIENPIEVTKEILNKLYGETWYKKYQISGKYKYPSLKIEHWIMRITPLEFSILVTSDKVYLLSSNDFNKFLKLNGENIEQKDITSLLRIYLKLYGNYSPGATDEEIFTEKNFLLLKGGLEEKYRNEIFKIPSKINIKKENKIYLVDFYAVLKANSFPRIPSPQDIFLSHYQAKIGKRGEVWLNLIDRKIYKEAIKAGQR